MRTAGNVMGVQARFILEKIDETWKVLRSGAEQSHKNFLFSETEPWEAILLGGADLQREDESREEKPVYAVRKPAVFDDQRLSELPEPNWSCLGQGSPLPVMLLADRGRECGGAPALRSSRTSHSRYKPKRQNRTGQSVLVWIGEAVRGGKKEPVRQNEPQDTRSAPAPPHTAPV